LKELLLLKALRDKGVLMLQQLQGYTKKILQDFARNNLRDQTAPGREGQPNKGLLQALTV
jgi:hypothetical protein